MGDYSTFYGSLNTAMISGDYAVAKNLLTQPPHDWHMDKLAGIFASLLQQNSLLEDNRLRIYKRLSKHYLNALHLPFWNTSSNDELFDKILKTCRFDLAVKITRIAAQHDDRDALVGRLACRLLPAKEIVPLLEKFSLWDDEETYQAALLYPSSKKLFDDYRAKRNLAEEEEKEVAAVRASFAEKRRKIE